MGPHVRRSRREGAPGARSGASSPGRTAPHHGGAAPHVGYDGVDQPLWIAQQGALLYYEVDAVGNVRRLHGDASPSTWSGEQGGYSYTAFGKTIAASEPGGVAPPSSELTQPFQWQGKRLMAPGLYDSRARVWSADLGAFLQPDEYVFLTRSGTLWSWPGQNPFKYRDPSGRDGDAAFLRFAGYVEDALPYVASAAAQRRRVRCRRSPQPVLRR